MAKVSVATNRSLRDPSSRSQEWTEWDRLTFFGRLGAIVGEHLAKGDGTYAEGGLACSKVNGDDATIRPFSEDAVHDLRLSPSLSPRPTESRCSGAERAPTVRGCRGRLLSRSDAGVLLTD